MKKLFLSLLLMAGMSASAQDETKSDYNGYLTVGLSLTEGNFEQTSYPSVEFGISKKWLAVGAVFGRGNLEGAFSKNDVLGNYFWEGKLSPYYSIGNLTVNVFGGAGAYFNFKHYFWDAGVGASYSINNYSYGVSFSNWDGVNYVTPTITYNF